MATLKKYNKKTGQWEVITSDHSSSIKEVSLGEDIKTVNDALVTHQDDITEMKRNIAWLALHGGGGSGSGTGGDVTVSIVFKNLAKVVQEQFVVSGNTLRFYYQIQSSVNYARFNVSLYINGQSVQITNNKEASPNEDRFVEIDLTKYGVTENTYTISITATHTQLDFNTYGSINAVRGSVFLRPVEENVLVANSLIDSTTVKINYQVQLTSEKTYMLLYSTSSSDFEDLASMVTRKITEEEDPDRVGEYYYPTFNSSVLTTALAQYAIPVTSLIQPPYIIGEQRVVYMQMVEVSQYDIIKSDIVNFSLQIISSTQLSLSSYGLSVDVSNPTSVYKTSQVKIPFVAYLYGASDYRYELSWAPVVSYEPTTFIDEATGVERTGFNINYGDFTTFYSSDNVVSFEQTVSYTWSSLNTIEAIEYGKLYAIKLHAYNSNNVNQSGDLYMYIQINDEVNDRLDLGIDNRKVFEFDFFQPSKYLGSSLNPSKLVCTNSSYIKESKIVTVSSELSVVNVSNNATIRGNYYAFNHGAYGIINNFKINNSSVRLLNNVIGQASGILYNTKFTFSITFKTVKSIKDNHVIFNWGNKNPENISDGTGIIIRNHDYSIRLGENTYNGYLVDDQVINLTIVFFDTVDSTQSMKIYQNGVLNGIVKYQNSNINSSLNTLGQYDMQIACCNYNGEYKCVTDVDVYSIQLFENALNVQQVVKNYLNCLMSVNITDDGAIDLESKKVLLDNNFIDGTTEKSLLYNEDSQAFTDWSTFVQQTDTGTVQINQQFANNVKLPILVLDTRSNTNWTFDNFSATSSGDELSVPTITDAKFNYFLPGSAIADISTTCSVGIQGTSSKGYSIKNLEIIFDNELLWLKDDWYPENEYTLKADVVDSAHMNNAVVGNFVNRAVEQGVFPKTPPAQYVETNINTTFAEIPYIETTVGDTVRRTPKPTVKICGEGFQFLLAVIFYSEDKMAGDTKSLGIYTFTLGRQSIYNFGYKLLKRFRKKDGSIVNPSNGYAPMLLQEPETDDVLDMQAQCWEGSDSYNGTLKTRGYGTGKTSAEDGSPFTLDGFFWSWDLTALAQQWSNKYIHELHSGATTTELQDLMRFIVNYCEYSKGDCQIRYDSNVPVYSYKVENNLAVPFFDNSDGTHAPTVTRGGNGGLGTKIEADSIAGYYIICMLFGLVDSLGKNMQLKRWDSPLLGTGIGRGVWYVAFYDMDTALGLSNSGSETISPYVYDTVIENSTDGNVASVQMLYKEDSDSARRRFTVYTNKLWGIFTSAFKQEEYGSDTGGDVMAIKWSNVREKLAKNLEILYNDYIISQIKNSGELLYNMDFNIKYEGTPQQEFMHGDRKYFVYNWMNKRLKFLDSVYRYLQYTAPVQNDSIAFLTTSNNPDSSSNKRITIGHNSQEPTLNTIFNNDLIVSTSISGTSFTLVKEGEESKIPARVSVSDSIQLTVSNSDCILDITNIKTLGLQNITSSKVTTESAAISDYSDLEDRELYSSLESFEELDLSSVSTLSRDNPIVFKQLFKRWNTAASIYGSYKKNPYPSALKSIDLSNTKTTAVSNFVLDLSPNNSSVLYPNPFSNLTKLNLENSCVTSVILPTDITLSQFIIRNSNIATFSLTNQSLLNELDLTGCSNLTSFTLSQCDSIKSITIPQLPYLSSITLQDMRGLESLTINMDNANIVTNTLTVNITGSSPALTTVNMNNCKATNIIFNIQNAPNLKTVNLVAVKASQISLPSNCHDSLTTLDLRHSKVKYINWITNPGETALVQEPTSSDELYENVIDLRGFKNQGTLLTIHNNTTVEYIRFDNKSTAINLVTQFTNCTNLKRVYGNINLSKGCMFENCTKFSIHGYNENASDDWYSTYEGVKFNGQNVLIDKILKHPSELNYTAHQIISGDKVTNMHLNVTNPSTQPTRGNVAYYSMFYCSGITTFDAYYILYNNYIATNLYCMFYGCVRVRFYHEFDSANTKVYDNSPHRKMFINCTNVTYIGYMFTIDTISSSPLPVILYSPTVNSAGTVTEDNGLFSPLAKLQSITLLFGRSATSNNFIIDKYVFRRKSGKYVMTTIEDFCPIRICNNISTLLNTPASYSTYLTLSSTNTNYFGDMADFFKDFAAFGSYNMLKDTYSGIVFSNSFNTDFIQLDTIKNNIPAVSFIRSFRVNYATGNIDISELAERVDFILTLSRSFIVMNTISGQPKVRFEIRETSYSNYKRLRDIGNLEVGLIQSASHADYYSFEGAGSDKVIILQNANAINSLLLNCTNLVYADHMLSSSLIELDEGDYGNFKLPGAIFENCKNLTSARYCFYNFGVKNSEDFKFELTSEGFANCNNIQDLQGLFAASSYQTHRIRSMIPYKFLYHGEPANQTLITRTGINQETFELNIPKDNMVSVITSGNSKTFTSKKLDSSNPEEVLVTTDVYTITNITSFEELENNYKLVITPLSKIVLNRVIGTYDTEANLLSQTESTIYNNIPTINAYNLITTESETFTYKNVYRKINNVSYMFEHQDILNYDNRNPELENNPNYSPYLYNYANNTYTFNSTRELKKQTFMWSYDGSEGSIPESLIVENDINETYNNVKQTLYLDDVISCVKLPSSHGDYPNCNTELETIHNIPIDIANNQYALIEYNTQNFAFPPDLLRYCTTNVNCAYLFSECGHRKNVNKEYIEEIENTSTPVQFGLRGRIVPYMFYNNPDITSVEGMFLNCKLLHYYSTSENKSYVIPKSLFKYAAKITNLGFTFAGIYFPANTDLDVFRSLSRPLDVRCCFRYSAWFGTSTISNVFYNNNIVHNAMCFAVTGPQTTLPNGYWTAKYENPYNYSYQLFNSSKNVKFTNVFKSAVANLKYTDGSTSRIISEKVFYGFPHDADHFGSFDMPNVRYNYEDTL